MSLLPFFFDSDDYMPSNQFLVRFPREDEFLMRPRHFLRQMLENQDSASGEKTVMNKNGFHINLNVRQFAPEEIDVKTAGNEIIVEGKHEEKKDEHGYISRHFVRRYELPADHDVETAKSTLSSDGVLTVSVQKAQLPGVNARNIPITHTGNIHKPLENSQADKKAD